MKRKTYYHIILDQSGSMQDSINQTISSFNEQIQVIQSLQSRFIEQELKVGLTLFNQEVKHIYFDQNPTTVHYLDSKTYIPNGSTALYDAVGTSVSSIKERFNNEILEGYTTIIVVILTDGFENSSKLFNQGTVKRTIKELELSGKWTFSFLGSTIDAVEIAHSLSIKPQNSMYFEKENISEAFCTINRMVSTYIEENH
jgi:hypothetical protein